MSLHGLGKISAAQISDKGLDPGTYKSTAKRQMIQFLNEQDQNRHDTKEDTLMTMKAKFKDKRSHFLLSQSLPDVARRWSSEVLVFESSLHLGQEEA